MRNEFNLNYSLYVEGNKKKPRKAIFINCSGTPFIDLMFWKHKKYETRKTNSLDVVKGERVLLVETGKGDPIVRGWATIGEPFESLSDWEKLRSKTCVPKGSRFDRKSKKDTMWLYPIIDPEEIRPFKLPECKRHGRVYADLEIGDREMSKLATEYEKVLDRLRK